MAYRCSGLMWWIGVAVLAPDWSGPINLICVSRSNRLSSCSAVRGYCTSPCFFYESYWKRESVPDLFSSIKASILNPKSFKSPFPRGRPGDVACLLEAKGKRGDGEVALFIREGERVSLLTGRRDRDKVRATPNTPSSGLAKGV